MALKSSLRLANIVPNSSVPRTVMPSRRTVMSRVVSAGDPDWAAAKKVANGIPSDTTTFIAQSPFSFFKDATISTPLVRPSVVSGWNE